MKIVNGRGLRVEGGSKDCLPSYWSLAVLNPPHDAEPEVGAPTRTQEADGGGQKAEDFRAGVIGKRVGVGKGGQEVGKWTRFARLEPGSTRLGPDVSTQVVDFPCICDVRLFGERMEFETQGPVLWPSCEGTQWVGLRSRAVSPSTNRLRRGKLCPAVAENQPVILTKYRMTDSSPFSTCIAQVREFIQRHSAPAPGISTDESRFNELALSLFALQFAHNAPYGRLCRARKATPDTVRHWREIPAMPAAGFKEFELTSLPTEWRTRVFHSSGTTAQQPSRHFHDGESLSLYEDSLLPWFRAHLLPENARLRFISLTPPPMQAKNSSLVHMFATVHESFGSANSIFTGHADNGGDWQIDVDKTVAALHEATVSNYPVVLLGTAFDFIHLIDHLRASGARIQLPPGSRALETGGYKGRTRELPKLELHALITRLLGIVPDRIVSEYGMSELGSQAYDCVAGNPAGSQLFRFPPWARVQIISAETGREVGEGETGLIRIFDLATVRSVMAIQTEDLGVRRGGGFELLGRAAMAEARGCSLMSMENTA